MLEMAWCLVGTILVMDLNSSRESRTVRDFDNHCTRHVGKYETVDTYYRRCGSSQFLEGVAVPLLCISAEDDPICTKEAIPYDECRVNPNIILAVTKHGGHLGYFDGWGAKTIWYARAATEFSKVLLSSSLMHQQSKGTALATTRVESDIDQGPFLALGEDLTVAAQKSGIPVEDVNAVLEEPAKTSELRSEPLQKAGVPLIHEGSQLAQDKSGISVSGQFAADVSDDCGGPIYKPVEDIHEKGDTSARFESVEDKPSPGQTTVKLQIRSFSELIALQSVLSQVLQQIRQQASFIEESRKDAASGNLEHPSQRRTLTISPISQGGSGETPKDLSNREKSAAKEIIHKYSKKAAVKEASISAQANPVNKLLASSLASHNRRTFLLLAYIAVMTTVPLLGSALMLRTRGRIWQILARQWGKFNKA